jgi:predicted DNA-binding protein
MSKWTAVNLPKDLYEQVRREAAAQERSIAWVVRKAVEAYLGARA